MDKRIADAGHYLRTGPWRNNNEEDRGEKHVRMWELALKPHTGAMTARTPEEETELKALRREYHALCDLALALILEP